MSRASLLLLLAAGCGGPPERAAPSCQTLLERATKTQTQLLTRGVRTVSRVRLERLDRALAEVAGRCQKSRHARTARRARARLRDAIARASRAPEDVRAALLAYADLSRLHGRSPAAAQALWRRATLSLEFDRRRAAFALLEQLVRRHGKSAEARRAQLALEALSHLRPASTGGRTAVRTTKPRASAVQGSAVVPDRLGIRFRRSLRPSRLLRVLRWSTPEFSRVVSYFVRPVRYLHGVIPAEGARPARLYLDFPGSQLSPRVKRADAARGHLVQGLRLANRPPESSRLVLELSRPLRYQIYPLRHPYRVVVDLWKAGPPAPKPGQKLNLRVVALDPGHGGSENGAVGPTGLKEKDVTLAIARHAAEALKAGGLKTVLTRDGDKRVSLEERSAIALAVGADILVSIHANADPTGVQQGVETYYLDVGADEYAARLAARENRAAGRAVSSYRLVLADLTTRSNTRRSKQLAALVQQRLVAAAQGARPGLPDRGVRKAIFYVLLTARVPGVLTEVSFISHPKGEAALRQPDYLKRLGQGIARAILSFAGKNK